MTANCVDSNNGVIPNIRKFRNLEGEHIMTGFDWKKTIKFLKHINISDSIIN